MPYSQPRDLEIVPKENPTVHAKLEMGSASFALDLEGLQATLFATYADVS